MANPDDTAALAAAFTSAHYLVPALGDTGRVHVGVQATALESCVPAAGYAFITAWNPDSASASRVDNDREDGGLVLDLPVRDTDRLARRFSQDGVLTWQAGQPVRLRLYHHEPEDAA